MKQRGREFWEQLNKVYENGHDTMQSLAKQNGVSVHTLKWWRQQFLHERREVKTHEARPVFLPVIVENAPPPAIGTMSVHLPNGVRLSFEGTITPEFVHSLAHGFRSL